MRRGSAIILAIALASSSASSVARAQTPDPKRAFEEAVEIEKKGEYETALDRFRKIEAIKPTAGVLFHEAYCLEMLGKLAPAYDAYERADKLARETNKQDVLTAVHSRLDPLAKRVPMVNVTVEPKEARITIDGQPVTNMSTRVEAGDHDLLAEMPGYTPKKLRLQCREGSVQSVALTLVPVGSNPPPAAAGDPKGHEGSSTGAPPPPVTEPPREEPKRASIALPLAVTGGAVVFLVGGVVSFLVAGSAQSDAKETCPQKLSCDDERKEVRTFDALALTGFIGGVALGGLAVVLWTGRSSGSAKVTASGSSLYLRGEF